MKRKFNTRYMLAIIASLVCVYWGSAFAIVGAASVPTLDQVTASSQSATSSSASSGASSDMGNLLGAAKVDLNNAQAEQSVAGLKGVIAYAVCMIVWVIVAMLALVLVINLAYVVVPPVTELLGGGSQSDAAEGTGAALGSNFGGGGFGGSGFGGSGFGGGGLGGGFGGSGFGGSGFGGGYRSPYGGASGQGRINKVSSLGKSFIFKSVMRGVEMDGQPGQDGKIVSKYKVYIKEMVFVLCATPILIIFATNGVIFDIGLKLGALLSSALSNLNL